jgi:hypothetical protein
MEDGWWKEKHGFQFVEFFLCKPKIQQIATTHFEVLGLVSLKFSWVATTFSHLTNLFY